MKMNDDKKKAILIENLSIIGQRLDLGASELPLTELFARIYYIYNLSE